MTTERAAWWRENGDPKDIGVFWRILRAASSEVDVVSLFLHSSSFTRGAADGRRTEVESEASGDGLVIDP